MDTELFNFYNLIGTELSAAVIVFNLLFSFVLQIGIVWVYKKTHRGLSHSQTFLFTLVIIGVLGTTILMVVQNNLIGAFALLGAFSLIRFRTIVKETRDVAFVFFALAIGVAVGTNNYSVALIAAVLISTMIFFLSRYGFFGLITKESMGGYVLTLETSSDLSVNELQSKLASYGVAELLHAKHDERKGGHYAYSMHFRDAGDLHKLSQDIVATRGVNRHEFITSKHSVEY
jgi:uncharacterized membrane protein YhiD involved in acid resistance